MAIRYVDIPPENGKPPKGPKPAPAAEPAPTPADGKGEPEQPPAGPSKRKRK